jgi:hypothetical protein
MKNTFLDRVHERRRTEQLARDQVKKVITNVTCLCGCGEPVTSRITNGRAVTCPNVQKEKAAVRREKAKERPSRAKRR